jgi:hypothetical protein
MNKRQSFLDEWASNPLGHNWQAMPETERKNVRAQLPINVFEELSLFHKLMDADILEIKP